MYIYIYIYLFFYLFTVYVKPFTSECVTNMKLDQFRDLTILTLGQKNHGSFFKDLWFSLGFFSMCCTSVSCSRLVWKKSINI